MTRLESIPDALKRLERWVCTKDGSKTPYCALTGKRASSTDSTSWSTFEEAADLVERGVFDHVGFVFADDGFVGIDIDKCFDEWGVLSDEAVEAMRDCPSYTELSMSEDGLHIIVRGDIPFKGRNSGSVEVYKSGRFFVLTGNACNGLGVEETQEGLDRLVEREFKEMLDRSVQGGSRSPLIYEPTWTLRKDGRVPLDPEWPDVSSGARHISMVSFYSQMVARDMSPDECLEAAIECNGKHMKPPLPDAELMAIARSGERYRYGR